MKKLFILALITLIIVSFIVGFLACRAVYEHEWKRFCKKYNHYTDKQLIDELIDKNEQIDKV